MRRFQIVESGVNEFHAGKKAPSDAFEIAMRCGFRPLEIKRVVPTNKFLKFLYNISWVVKCIVLLYGVPKQSVVFTQYPNNNVLSGRLGLFLYWGLCRCRKAKLITLIHDINELRTKGSNANVKIGEILNSMIALSNVLIVHNDIMRNWLIGQGCAKDKMVTLGVFDYLSNREVKAESQVLKFEKTIAIAGNLNSDKTGYLAALSSVTDVVWHLYGPNFESCRIGGANIVYKGCYPPDELPNLIEACFGLVWDGDSIETCSGACGEYLRYNNPHKLSLYLAAGIPVIIWADAAEADFVVKANVGVAVSSLETVGNVLDRISNEEYGLMRRNAREMSRRVREGYFLDSAIKEALNKLNQYS